MKFYEITENKNEALDIIFSNNKDIFVKETELSENESKSVIKEAESYIIAVHVTEDITWDTDSARDSFSTSDSLLTIPENRTVIKNNLFYGYIWKSDDNKIIQCNAKHECYLISENLQNVTVFKDLRCTEDFNEYTQITHCLVKKSSIPTSHVFENGQLFIFDGTLKYPEALKSVTIPSSVELISENAFMGCSSELVIRAARGSYAEKYAQNHGLKFDAISE